MIRKIVVIVLLLTSLSFMAQRSNSSPYSYFGVGEEFNTNTVIQNSMGGIGVAFNHYKYLNFTNPAATANLRYTTYGFGLLNNDLTVKTTNNSQNSTSTSISYVALAVPIGKKAGFSIGLQPFSSVGYSLNNAILNSDGSTSEITLYSGNGGINRLYGTFGFIPIKNLSLGVEADFSFGNIENSIINQRANVSLATKYNEQTSIRGTAIKFGAQYKKQFKNQVALDLGATVKLENELNVTGKDYLYSLTFNSSGNEAPRDTIAVSTINGQFVIPIKSTFGIGLGKLDKWYAGVEYQNQDAFITNGLLANTNSAYKYGNSNRISLGGYYLPKINSISSYWKRVTYRAGLRFENTGLLVDGTGANSNFTEIKDFGISFGLGLPLKRLSTVNAGLEFGRRGTTENNLIQENYFNFRLSLSLSDTWFIKRRID